MIVDLSEREEEILRMAAQGVTDKEICGRLHITMSTVRTHWDRIRKKLGAVNRSHAIAVTMERSTATEVESRPMTPFECRVQRQGPAIRTVILASRPSAKHGPTVLMASVIEAARC